MTETTVDGYRIPEDLTSLDIWVLWDGREKAPRAPWVTGDMYRAGWGDGVVADPESRMEERPETDYETAKQFADLDPKILHESHAFPRTPEGRPDLPDRVTPTIILPHYPAEPSLMLVDFDDVRDPETGKVNSEVLEIIHRLGAYTEVSTSGEGIHVFVRASLPGRLGKFIAPLDEKGAIELYDHGRFVGCTWQHVEGTPMEVPERQDVIDELVERYETEAIRRRRERSTSPDDVTETIASVRGNGSVDRNRYFEIDIRAVADRGYFGQYRRQAPGDDWTGPHPAHGPIKSAPEQCSNFGIDPSKNAWHCFAHGIGGGPLHLIAVLEGILDCTEADGLNDRPEALLQTCLAARDSYAAGLEEVDPPYRALEAIARKHDLIMADSDAGRLGKDCWNIARKIFDEIDATAV